MKSPAFSRRLSLLFRPRGHSMNIRGCLCFLATAALCALAVAAVPSQTGPPPGVRASLVADSTELTVGDLVTLSLIVSHPEDSTVIVPRLDREWGPFEVEAQTSVQTVSLANGVRTVAKQFRVTLFAPGTFETPEIPVSIRGPDGAVALISPDPAHLTVNSVLSSPEDELKDLRPPADLSTPFWERPVVLALMVVVVLGLLGGAAFAFYRRSRRGDVLVGGLADLRTPWEVATQELDHIAGLDLPGRGDMKGHYTLMAAVLRRYLGGTYLRDTGGVHAEDMSTEELAAHIRQSALDYMRARLVIELLQESDLVKFANHEPAAVRAYEVASLVREFVELTAPAFSNTVNAGAPAAQGAGS